MKPDTIDMITYPDCIYVDFFVIFFHRATTKINCPSHDKPNYWLTSLDKCAQLELSDNGIPVNSQKNVNAYYFNRLSFIIMKDK